MRKPMIACVTCLALLACVACASTGAPASPHFDGARFFNPEGADHSFGDTLRWLWEMDAVAWPEWIDDPARAPPVERVPAGGLRVTYVNHATVLIQTEGLNILTDPIWSTRAGPLGGLLGVKRVRAPGVPFDRLPPIDYVLVSHDHFDHLDLPTLRRIARRDHPRILVGLGVGRHLATLRREGVEVAEHDWWQETPAPGSSVRFVFVPARHGSGRGPLSGDRTLWGGFVVAGAAGEVYFAGDTGLGGFVDEIAARFRRVRLAILPIGSYEKRWFMKAQHMNPEDAVLVHRRLGADRSMGIHYATFAEHPEQRIDAHEEDLAAALARQAVEPERFWVLGFGEGRDVPPLERSR